MLCTYFTSYRVVSLRAAWVTFDAPGWLDRDPYGIHTSSLSNNNNKTIKKLSSGACNSKFGFSTSWPGPKKCIEMFKARAVGACGRAELLFC